MPKETFFNLPDEKREMIVNIAIDEFSSAGFDKASINTIVDKCGIAKGSFYQYFKNKKDLFIYIIMEVGGKEKLKYVSAAMQNPEKQDFFVLIKDMYIAGLMFAKDNPKLSAMGMWTMKNSSHIVFQDILEQGKSMAGNIYKGLLQLAVSNGSIADDIDIDFVSHLLYSLSISTMEYCFENSSDKETLNINNFSDRILETVDMLIRLIKFGIHKNSGGSKL